MSDPKMPDLSGVLQMLMANPDMARGLLSMLSQNGSPFQKEERCDSCDPPTKEEGHCCDPNKEERYSNGFCDFTGVNHYEKKHHRSDRPCHDYGNGCREEKESGCKQKRKECDAEEKDHACFDASSALLSPCPIPAREHCGKDRKDDCHRAPGKKERDALIAAIRPFLSGERQEKMGQILQMAEVLSQFKKRGEH